MFFWASSDLRKDHESELSPLWVFFSWSWSEYRQFDVETPLLLLVGMTCLFWFVVICYHMYEQRHLMLFACGSDFRVYSAAVLQEFFFLCVGACRSYFRLSGDAAAAFWCSVICALWRTDWWWCRYHHPSKSHLCFLIYATGWFKRTHLSHGLSFLEHTCLVHSPERAHSQ